MKIIGLHLVRTGFIALYSLILLVNFASYGQTPLANIDSILNKHFAQNSPGAAVLVAKGDRVLYRGAVGLADLEHEIKLSPDMKFYIGSNTKQFTAVAVLLLVQQGKMSLTDNLCTYFPYFSNNCAAITIHHLLNHTSGIYDYTADGEAFINNVGHNMTLDDMFNRIKKGGINSQPGEVFAYNNSAYFLLGLIIEQLSGGSYAKFIDKNIFQPTGMSNSEYGNYFSIIKNRVRGYDQKNGAFTNAAYWDHNQVYSAGALVSTIDDMLKWRNALNNLKLLDETHLKLAQTNFKQNNGEFSHYGYGFFIGTIADKSAVHHGGGFSGFNSYTAYFGEQDLTIIALSNAWWSSRKVKNALVELAQFMPE
jgi:CubicO group peptidase (beta-lactamase class C family)